MIAGKVALGRGFTLEELVAVAERIAAIAPDLECALLTTESAASAYAPMSGELVIGVPLAMKRAYAREPLESIPRALRKVRAVPASTWAEIAALLPGGLSDEMAIHLGCFGEKVHVSGEVEVARVSASGSRRAIVDLSGSVARKGAAAHFLRVE